jgi:GNAT superfamily N-acetyltransferase
VVRRSADPPVSRRPRLARGYARPRRPGRGTEFRGQIQTGARRYLASIAGKAFGYVDCGTFDRHVVYGGEGPDGPITIAADWVATGSIAFTVAPDRRRHGLGHTMISTLMQQPELRAVELFEAGVEPDNLAARRCLEAAGFALLSPNPDFEGMLDYLARRAGQA